MSMDARSSMFPKYRETILSIEEIARWLVASGVAGRITVVRQRRDGTTRVVVTTESGGGRGHLSLTPPTTARAVDIGQRRWWLLVDDATDDARRMAESVLEMAIENAEHRLGTYDRYGDDARSDAVAWLEATTDATVCAIGMTSAPGYLASEGRATRAQRQCARLVESRGGMFATLMSDCWLMIVPDERGQSDVNELVDAVRTEISSVCGEGIEVGVRVGWTTTRTHPTGADTITAALDALDVARTSQTVEVVMWEPPLADTMRKRRRVRRSLPRAIRSGEVDYALQPQVNILTGTIVGAEALLRWPDHSTGDVVAELEHNPRTSIELDRHSLERVVELLATTDGISLSVNVSAPYVRNGLLDDLARLRVPDGRLVVEITEEVALHNLEVVAETVTWCHEHGISVSLDDFGTANNSLSVLHALPVHELKVAREFLHDATSLMSAFAIVSGMSTLATVANLRVIAEGIEQPEEANLWLRLGGTLVQGYLSGKPMSIPAFVEHMHNGANLTLATPVWDARDRLLLEPHDRDTIANLDRWRERLAVWWLTDGSDRFAHLTEVRDLGDAIRTSARLGELPELARRVVSAIDAELATRQFSGSVVTRKSREVSRL